MSTYRTAPRLNCIRLWPCLNSILRASCQNWLSPALSAERDCARANLREGEKGWLSCHLSIPGVLVNATATATATRTATAGRPVATRRQSLSSKFCLHRERKKKKKKKKKSSSSPNTMHTVNATDCGVADQSSKRGLTPTAFTVVRQASHWACECPNL